MLIKILIRFLKEKGLFEFIYANISLHAFDWEDTQEEHRFWSNLNYKFVDYILNKIK